MSEKPHNFTMKLQVVMLPVADVDKSIEFYRDKVGFNLDHDVNHGEVRVVQFTPPGSDCSIVMGENMEALQQMKAGAIRGLHLVVDDLDGVRDHLLKNNIEVSEIVDYGGGIRMAGFSDLDGNSWALQEINR